MTEPKNKYEEMARAHWNYINAPKWPWEKLMPAKQYEEVNAMRAAVAVLREPSEAMVKAGKWYDGNPEGCWQAMIDEMEGE